MPSEFDGVKSSEFELSSEASSFNKSGHSSGAGTSDTSASHNQTSRLSYLAEEASRVSIRRRYSRRTHDSGDSLGLAELTINKLQFSSLGLYGREDSIRVLENCLDEVTGTSSFQRQTKTTPSASPRPFVLISGHSGTGKTALAKSLELPVLQKRGLFVRGKFDQNLRNEPYSGIKTACRELCSAILAFYFDRGSNLDSLRDEITNDLGDEISLLTISIPDLKEIVGHGTSDKTDNPYQKSYTNQELEAQKQQQQNLKDTKQRFHYAFQRFIRLISKSFAPLVILLDDIHWADPASMELLQVLVSDQEICGLLLIGCYRSNEIEESHMLKEIISTGNSGDKEVNPPGYRLVQISVDCLNVGQINNMLMDLLSTDDPGYTLALAKICHRKTLGNAFFLIHFINMLKDNFLLEYSLGHMKWTWDLAEIENQTVAADNVVDLMKSKIERLPQDTRNCVQLAACLGFVFDFEILRLVWKKYNIDESRSSDQNIAVFLDPAIEEGLIEESKKGKEYRWIHDKIQEACLSCLPPEELRKARYRIGRILATCLSPKELEESIFVAADLLNEGVCNITILDDRIHLAEINLQAARNAVKLSAFENAEQYASKGIILLPSNKHWSDHYDLSLQLYSTAAEMAGYLGDFDSMNKYCIEVLEHGKSFEDKLRAYNVRFDSLLSRNPSEAVPFGVDMLRSMGCSFPRKKVTIIASIFLGLMRAKRSAKKLAVERAVAKKMEDPPKVELMNFLDKFVSACYLMKNPLAPLAALHMMDLTSKYGFCDVSPVAYASTGFLVGGYMSDFQGGAAYANCALSVLKETKSRWYFSRTSLLIYGFILHLSMPVHVMLKPLVESYEMGMKTGDTTSAMWSIYEYMVFSFQCGTPLHGIEEDCRTYLQQMKSLQKEIAWNRALPVWQLVHNLMGRAEDPTELVGEIWTTEHAKNSIESKSGLLLQSCQLFLLAHLGEYDRGADIALPLIPELKKQFRGFRPMVIMTVFLGGMCLFVKAQKTNNRVYGKHARKCLATIRHLVEKGNPNARHWEALLAAENEVLKGKRQVAIQYYQTAVRMASRFGFIHDAAMAHLRLGDFMNDTNVVLRDREEALFRVNQAKNLYIEWGAQARVDRIFEEYEDLLPKPSDILVTVDEE